MGRRRKSEKGDLRRSGDKLEAMFRKAELSNVSLLMFFASQLRGLFKCVRCGFSFLFFFFFNHQRTFGSFESAEWNTSWCGRARWCSASVSGRWTAWVWEIMISFLFNSFTVWFEWVIITFILGVGRLVTGVSSFFLYYILRIEPGRCIYAGWCLCFLFLTDGSTEKVLTEMQVGQVMNAMPVMINAWCKGKTDD